MGTLTGRCILIPSTPKPPIEPEALGGGAAGTPWSLNLGIADFRDRPGPFAGAGRAAKESPEAAAPPILIRNGAEPPGKEGLDSTGSETRAPGARTGAAWAVDVFDGTFFSVIVIREAPVVGGWLD